jgi:hypothetical protein
MAVWQTSLGGLDWLKELAKAGKASGLVRNGCPARFTATAGDLTPTILKKKPPHVLDPWVCGSDDIIGKGWDGKAVIDRDAVAQCKPWRLADRGS